MTVYQITARPNKLAGVFANPYLLRNAGTTTIYLGTDSSLAVGTQSLSLTAGSTLNWAGGSELWAITATGQTGVLEVMQDAGSAFTPGPTNVTATIDGPVDTSGSIIDIGNTVDVTGSVNLITDAEVVYRGFTSVPLGGSAVAFTDLVVGQYSSILVQIQSTNAPPIPFPTNFDHVLYTDFTWEGIQTGVGQFDVAADSAISSLDGRMNLMLTTKAELLTLRLSLASGAPATQYAVAVLGFKVALPEYYYHRWRNDGSPDGFQLVNVNDNNQSYFAFSGVLSRNTAGVNIGISLMSTYSGPVHVVQASALHTAATPTSSMVLRTYNTNTPSWLLQSAPIDVRDFGIAFPRAPVFLRCAMSVGSAVLSSTQFQLTLLYQGVNAEK